MLIGKDVTSAHPHIVFQLRQPDPLFGTTFTAYCGRHVMASPAQVRDVYPVGQVLEKDKRPKVCPTCFENFLNFTPPETT